MWYLSIDIFKLQIGSMSFVLYNNVFWWPLTQKLETWLEVWQMGRFNMSLDAKHDMWTYLVSYSVKWKYWNVPCRENEILAYMATILINMKVEFVPWFKTWYFNLFGFKCGKMKVLKWPLSRSLIIGKFELVPWRPSLQTWSVNLFGFVFGKMKYWIDPCRENEILVYMPTIFINGMFELVPWCETWYVSLFDFVFCKMEVWNDFVSKVFAFVFGKMKVV